MVFVLDSSASVGSVNFHKQIDFVSNITVQLNVGPSHAQVMALMTALMMALMMVWW